MSFTFFTDRDLGKQFPLMLRDAGVAVELHGDHFAHDAPDDFWLADIGRRGWVAITRDQRIRYRPNEVDAVLRSRVRLLVVVGKAKHAELAQSFLVTLPRIYGFLKKNAPPFIAKVYRSGAGGPTPGRVERWHPKERE